MECCDHYFVATSKSREGGCGGALYFLRETIEGTDTAEISRHYKTMKELYKTRTIVDRVITCTHPPIHIHLMLESLTFLWFTAYGLALLL